MDQQAACSKLSSKGRAGHKIKSDKQFEYTTTKNIMMQNSQKNQKLEISWSDTTGSTDKLLKKFCKMGDDFWLSSECKVEKEWPHVRW